MIGARPDQAIVRDMMVAGESHPAPCLEVKHLPHSATAHRLAAVPASGARTGPRMDVGALQAPHAAEVRISAPGFVLV